MESKKYVYYNFRKSKSFNSFAEALVSLMSEAPREYNIVDCETGDVVIIEVVTAAELETSLAIKHIITKEDVRNFELGY